LRIGSNIPIEPEQRGRQRDRNESAPERYRGHLPLDQFERGRFFTEAYLGQREEIDALEKTLDGRLPVVALTRLDG